MRLTTHRTRRLSAPCLRAFVVILGLVAAAAVVSAQETKPATDFKMPDITGTWGFTHADGGTREIVLSRVQADSADFECVEKGETLRVKWSAKARQFAGTIVTAIPESVSKVTMLLTPDQRTLSVSISLSEQAKQHILRSRPQEKVVDTIKQEWKRAETVATVDQGRADGQRPVFAVGLEPATLLVKQVAELFGPRGMTVTAFEEGKTLTIAATNKEVVEDFSKLMELVAQQFRKQAEPGPKPTVKKTNALAVEPATPLVKSLVQLFEFRGAKVLEFEAGKRLKAELPDDVLTDLEQMLRLIADETKKQADFKVPDISGLYNPDGIVLNRVGAIEPEPRNPTPEKNGAQETTQPIPAGNTSSKDEASSKIAEIVGTWSRAESGTFSKFTIWPVENHVLWFFVEGADGNGLLEWAPARSQYLGSITFIVLGDWSAPASLVIGPKETRRLIVSPSEGQKKELLRSGFAKTERELDEKLSASWTRVEAPSQPKPVPTVTVVKTEIEPSRVCELLRAKYREQPYRFFSNDTFRSVSVVAPAEVQDEIEALIHELDVNVPARTDDGPAAKSVTNDAPQDAAVIRAFTLQNASAVECATRLNDLKFKARITADARTNSILAAGLEDQLQVIEAILLQLDEAPAKPAASVSDSLTEGVPRDQAATGILNTPDAKPLVAKLQAQESAAATEAATIRQLQANGQAEQNQPAIADHQRKLKNLLSTAFDLKLQVEELQVRELQSRLSRLERQIGQRKELREKIINRRAGELIEGDALKWESSRAAAANKSTTLATEPKTSNNAVATQSRSYNPSYPSYQDFAARLFEIDRLVTVAKQNLKSRKYEVELGEADPVIGATAQKQVDDAVWKQNVVADELRAVLRDFELQIESAQAEAEHELERVSQLEGVGSRKATEDAQLRLRQATLALERLKVRYELYKRAGKGLATEGPMNPTNGREKDSGTHHSPQNDAANNLQLLMSALLGYHLDPRHGHLPTAIVMGKDGKGKVPHSWRVEILPFLGEQALYDEYHFDEPWDSQHNRLLIARMPAVFRSPLDKPDSTNASYFALVTPGLQPQLANDAPNAGGLDGGNADQDRTKVVQNYDHGTVLSNPAGTNSRDILDGVSNVVVLVEARTSLAAGDRGGASGRSTTSTGLRWRLARDVSRIAARLGFTPQG